MIADFDNYPFGQGQALGTALALRFSHAAAGQLKDDIVTDQTLLTLLVLAILALSYGAGYANGYSQCRKDRNREVHDSAYKETRDCASR